MRLYGTHDFKRFVYTWGLTRGLSGKCLELGTNPYFTTILLNKFGDLDLTLANYFSDEISAKKVTKEVIFTDPDSELKGGESLITITLILKITDFRIRMVHLMLLYLVK